MLNIVVAHTEKYAVFHTINVQQSLVITKIFSFIHTSFIGGHNLGPVNLKFHAAVTELSDAHTSVQAHCLAGRCQCHSIGTGGRSVSSFHNVVCIMQQ